MQTLRCRHCGADYLGTRCMYCGSDEFVDVSDHYNQENVVAYESTVTYFADPSSRYARTRVH